MALSLETIEEIKRKADIVKVISSYIPVSKKGNNYVALCPFHHDSNPSMQINQTKQIFKCFVCGTGGNVFGFVQKYENISFIEALKKVCEICNITIPDSIKYQKEKPKENAQEINAVKKLSEYYSFMLKSNEGRAAKEYIVNRGLDDDVIKHFGIGYAPSDNTKSIAYLRDKEKIDVAILDKAGITSSFASGFKDRYFDRLIFPLSNISGDIVGFSGRKYREGNADAKYINSPDSAIFHKSDILYNLNNALPAIKKNKYVYILEGFMDVIALYRAGIDSAVGLMGTALTKEHVAFFNKLGVEIRLSLDGDEPGQFATEKCLSILKGSGLKVLVVKPLTDGKDADEVLKADGREALIKQMNNLELPIIHSLNYRIKHNELATYEDKEKFLSSMREYYLSAPLLGKEDMLKELSAGLGVSYEAIKSYYSSLGELKKPVNPIGTSDTPFAIESEEDLKNKEVNNCLLDFTYSRYKPQPKLQNYLKTLLRNEGQILSRMCLSKKALDMFDSSMDVFFSKAYDDVYQLLEEYFSSMNDLEDNSIISDSDYDNLNGLAEQIFQEKKQVAQENDSESALQNILNEEMTVKGVLVRLKCCHNPCRSFNQDAFKGLLYQHLTSKVFLEVAQAAKPGHEDEAVQEMAKLNDVFQTNK